MKATSASGQRRRRGRSLLPPPPARSWRLLIPRHPATHGHSAPSAPLRRLPPQPPPLSPLTQMALRLSAIISQSMARLLKQASPHSRMDSSPTLLQQSHRDYSQCRVEQAPLTWQQAERGTSASDNSPTRAER